MMFFRGTLSCHSEPPPNPLLHVGSKCCGSTHAHFELSQLRRAQLPLSSVGCVTAVLQRCSSVALPDAVRHRVCGRVYSRGCRGRVTPNSVLHPNCDCFQQHEFYASCNSCIGACRHVSPSLPARPAGNELTGVTIAKVVSSSATFATFQLLRL